MKRSMAQKVANFFSEDVDPDACAKFDFARDMVEASKFAAAAGKLGYEVRMCSAGSPYAIGVYGVRDPDSRKTLKEVAGQFGGKAIRKPRNGNGESV